MKNIIILTSGLSGSSVVANLFTKAGYWTGDVTCKKPDYDTYENSQLVYLNNFLLQQIDYDTEYSSVVKAEKLIEVEYLLDTIDLLPFKHFIDACNQSAPWIWKDPRLWITMPFWIRLLDQEDIQVVVVERAIQQRWISELLRRNIQSYGYCRHYNETISLLIARFLARHKVKNFNLFFDALIQQPEETLERLNSFIGCSLSLRDLREVYDKPLYKKTRGHKDYCLALLIYFKNFRMRLK